MGVETATIGDNLERVRERIARAAERSGRSPDQVTLLAVSKSFAAERIREAYAAGIRHFGENRVQEWEGKRPLLEDLEATWHLVGHLQSNKARRAVRLFDTIDSLDSAALAEKLDRAAAGEAPGSPNRKLPVLIEVRLAPEESKSGVLELDLPRLAETVMGLPHLDLRGLMAIPPFFADLERVRPYFRRLRELRDDLRQSFARGHSYHTADAPATGQSLLTELSMGMSHDFQVAIEEGATQVRLGTAVFGPRA